MNIDEKIKQDLENQSKQLDTLVGEKLGLFEYMKLGFASNIGWVVKLGYVLAIILSVIMIYCGYRFFIAAEDEQLFWGVCLIISFNAQVATKLWIFIQTSRNHLSREIRLMMLRLNNSSGA